MANYRDFMRLASPAQRNRSWLIIGPWDNPGTRTPMAEVGGLTFGPASLLDMNALHRQWYDWTMKEGKRPAFLHKHVAYYVTGLDLRPHAGSAAPADNYVYDPFDVRPEQLERTSIKNSITDDRSTVNPFGNGLVY